MTQSYWASLGLSFTLSPSGLTWPLVFLLMGSYVLFVFSLGHPWPVCFLWVFSSPFTNSAFSWVITNFIGLPLPNYFILILGVHGLAINPLFSLFALLLGLQWPILTFLRHILPMGMLFLSFQTSLSSFTSSRPICLFHKPVIHHSCCLGLMVLPLVCQTFVALVAGCSGFFCVLLGCLLWYYCCTGLGCLLWYWTQMFWVRELRLAQLELKLVRLVCKLCRACQEHAYGRQGYSEWVTTNRHDSKAKKKNTSSSWL